MKKGFQMKVLALLGGFMRFQFGNVVVVDDDQIGVIVKLWADKTYEVYVRAYNGTHDYKEEEIKHFVYSKELTEEEKEFY